MNNSTEPTLKMRFRLPNGEEFEAEGTREFIESQRNYFLNLIGQQRTDSLAASMPKAAPPATTQQHTKQYLWEQLFREEENTLILRKKSKLATPVDISILLIAGARVLLNKEGYSALELAKSLKASGIAGGRLDRLLAPGIQSGHLSAQGTKRSRTYKLSDSGFAKAYMLAEKLLQG